MYSQILLQGISIEIQASSYLHVPIPYICCECEISPGEEILGYSSDAVEVMDGVCFFSPWTN